MVFEIKKHNNQEYDFSKLERFTTTDHYNYQLGVALLLYTGSNAGREERKYFQNGILLSEEELQ